MPSIVIVTGTYPPHFRDGTAISFALLARRLAESGWAVTVLVSKGHRRNDRGPDKPQPGEISVRFGRPELADILALIPTSCDVVVTSKTFGFGARLADAIAPRRTVMYFQGQSAGPAPPPAPASLEFAFASQFLHDLYGPQFGREGPVLHPMIEPAPFRAITSRRTHVLAIGLARVKRPDIVAAVARQMPDIRFELVHNWRGTFRLRHLPLLFRRNLRLRPGVDDPQKLYGRARVLMMASDTEGWGRVVTEAQFAGIPTIARSVAALPESVGSGGVLLAPDASIDDWVAAIRAVFADESHYARLVAAARPMAERPELDPDRIFDGWLRLLAGPGAGATI